MTKNEIKWVFDFKIEIWKYVREETAVETKLHIVPTT